MASFSFIKPGPKGLSDNTQVPDLLQIQGDQIDKRMRNLKNFVCFINFTDLTIKSFIIPEKKIEKNGTCTTVLALPV